MQELNGASPPSPTANLLTGLNVDEYFTRTDASGTANFLRDALGVNSTENLNAELVRPNPGGNSLADNRAELAANQNDSGLRERIAFRYRSGLAKPTRRLY
ncbi:MAG: hypothetical protein ACREQN_19140 [Candidatus Binataceae bacterium]